MLVGSSAASKLGAVGLAMALILLPRPALAADAKYACISASTEGQTLRKADKLIAARAQMVICASAECPSIVRSYCIRWLEEIGAQIPSIVVRAQDAAGADLVDEQLKQAQLIIDGQPAKLDGRATALDPGEHTIELATGDARKTEKVLLVAGERSRLVVLKLPRGLDSSPVLVDGAPSPAAANSHAIPTGAWILGGAGVAGLLGAAYFGVAASNELTRLNASCAPHCTSEQTRAGRNDVVAFYGSLGVGLGALGGAVLWTIIAHRPDHGAPRTAATTAATTATTNARVTPLPGGALAVFTRLF